MKISEEIRDSNFYQEKCENDPSVTLNKSRQADKDCLKAFEKVKEAFKK